MDQSSIDRINALYHKSQAVGLTCLLYTSTE